MQFSVPPLDAIADRHGDIVDPQLVVFFAGNQFMVVQDLMAAFRQAHPQYQRIFVETLPPGILAKQIEGGVLVMGNLRITLKRDVYTAGKSGIVDRQKQHDWFADSYDYARNPLAILVARGNPKHIEGRRDLGRADVRVSMPNPAWEGIARQIEAGYRKAGGAALDHTIMDTKVKGGSTFLTRIYHRQSTLRVLQGGSDAAPVWSTEAYFQQQVLHHPVETVAIPAAQNVIATYTAGRMRNAPHEQAAKVFLAFMRSRAPTRSIENTASCRRTEEIAMRCLDPRRPIFARSLVITPWRSRAWRTTDAATSTRQGSAQDPRCNGSLSETRKKYHDNPNVTGRHCGERGFAGGGRWRALTGVLGFFDGGWWTPRAPVSARA